MDFEIVDGPIPKRTRARPVGHWRTFQCANCDSTFRTETGRASAFCSLRCKSIADTIRYARSADQRYGELPDDVAYAVRIKFGYTMAGGYDREARALSPERRAEVIKRDGGLCVMCGQPGAEIDHIDGASDDLANLRYLCRSCHQTVTEAHLTPITDEAQLELRDEMLVRRYADPPLRDCDSVEWTTTWRQWVKEHELTNAD